MRLSSHPVSSSTSASFFGVVVMSAFILFYSLRSERARSEGGASSPRLVRIIFSLSSAQLPSPPQSGTGAGLAPLSALFFPPANTKYRRKTGHRISSRPLILSCMGLMMHTPQARLWRCRCYLSPPPAFCGFLLLYDAVGRVGEGMRVLFLHFSFPK